MNTNKLVTTRKRGRPFKKEEHKLIGRRVSMTRSQWDQLDAFMYDTRFSSVGKVLSCVIDAINLLENLPDENMYIKPELNPITKKAILLSHYLN